MSGHFSPTTPESNSFASEPVKVSGFSDKENQNIKPPERVVIPELSIDLPVRQAPLVNGYWQVYSDSAGWGEGSGLPGQPGNQVVFAHARVGLFKPLRGAKEGMRVYIFTKDSWLSYLITDVKEVLPNQTEVIKPTEDETLTLYTCSGFGDSRRLIVIAKRN